MHGRCANQIESRTGRLLERVIHRLQSHPQSVVKIGVTRAVARRVDIRVGSATLSVHQDAVGAFQTRRNREVFDGNDSHADDH